MVLLPYPSKGPLPLSRTTSSHEIYCTCGTTQSNDYTSCVDLVCNVHHTQHDPSGKLSPEVGMVSEQSICDDTLENLQCCIDSLSCREILETESVVGKTE